MIPWIYLDPPLEQGEKRELRKDQIHHLIRVLRLTDGSPLVVADGQGEARNGQLIASSHKKAWALLKESVPLSTEAKSKVYLAPSLIKGDKMDYVIQKAVEIGAACIIPLLTSRSIKRWPEEQKEKKLKRWESIVEGAAAQSHRVVLPKIVAPVPLEQMQGFLPGEAEIAVCWEKEEHRSLKDVWQRKESNCPVVLVIGPEGSFTHEEVEFLISIGGKTVKLGPRILRAETASLVSLAITLYQLGDLAQ